MIASLIGMRRDMMRGWVLLVLLPALAAAQVATFSIVAYDPVNADWGVAVASRYFSVGAVGPWAAAQVGAIATQANVNVGDKVARVACE